MMLFLNRLWALGKPGKVSFGPRAAAENGVRWRSAATSDDTTIRVREQGTPMAKLDLQPDAGAGAVSGSGFNTALRPNVPEQA
jgi:hypothetical protein